MQGVSWKIVVFRRQSMNGAHQTKSLFRQDEQSRLPKKRQLSADPLKVKISFRNTRRRSGIRFNLYIYGTSEIKRFQFCLSTGYKHGFKFVFYTYIPDFTILVCLKEYRANFKY